MKDSSIENLSKSKNLKNPKNPEIEPLKSQYSRFQKNSRFILIQSKLVSTGFDQIFPNKIL